MSGSPPVAIVTGGSSGIGRAVAMALAGDGYAVAIVGRSASRLDSALQDLVAAAPADGPAPLALALDVSSADDMEAMAEKTLGRYGRIDVLVASAGLGKRADSTRVMPHATARLPLSEWNEVIAVNLRGAFLSNRAVLPAMSAQGSGQIINVCSSTTPKGLRGTPFGPAYCASKFGMVGLTEALAAEVEREGIRVQAVFPGPVATPLVDQTLLARPFGGAVESEHFAHCVLALVKHPVDATVVHPHILPFRGGLKRKSGGRATSGSS